MKAGTVSLLQRLVKRWPLLLALAFTVYSAALLTYAFDSLKRMREDANSHLVADNLRRAMTLADLAAEVRSTATGYADIHQIGAYLSNRDLGMSPRYGLNAMAAAIEARFQQLAEQAGRRWDVAAPRITYYSADRQVLADSAPGTAAEGAPPALAAETRVEFLPARDAIVVVTPVMHKGRPDGTVVTRISAAALFRSLLTAGAGAGYRELLLTADGTQLTPPGGAPALDPRHGRLLVGLADNTVLPAATVLGAPYAAGSADDMVLVKTAVRGAPLVLVTLVAEKLAYGHLLSRDVLLGAGVLLLAMLAGAFKLERMRQRAVDLENEVLGAERARALVESRNAELSSQIREREAAEARTADRNEQLNAVFALSPDGFVSFDEARRVKFANPALLRMTGITEAELLGLDEAAFSERLALACVPGASFPGVDALRRAMDATPAAAAEVGAGDTAVRGRTLIELANPAGRSVVDVKLRLARAATVSQILYLRDVTHEVEVDRMKTEFLSHAAHELRTPLASIFGFSELLLSQDFDAETRKDLLATIHRQTAWLVEIINELLDLSRIESRRGRDFHIERVDPDALLRDVAASLQADPRRWPLAIACEPGTPPVAGDATKLRQALTNVLGNAVKFSPDGGAIELSCTLRSADGVSQLGIAVRDHGMGMTPQQVARVGERFYRADTSGKIPGSGLGMAIVKEIVEIHGGRMTVDSEAGRGTCVTLWLPVAATAGGGAG